MNRSKRAAWEAALPDRKAERAFRPWFRRLRTGPCPVRLWEPIERWAFGGGSYAPAADARSLRPMRNAHGDELRCGARFDHAGECPDASNAWRGTRYVLTERPLSMFERLVVANQLAAQTGELSLWPWPTEGDLRQLPRWLAWQLTT